MKLMKAKPMRYLGLLPETMSLISLLEECSELSEIKIYVALRKTRKNEPLDDLADIFGLDRSTISKYIREAIPLLAGYLKRFIYWPDKEVIKSNLPLAFRAYYSDVESIIDCFEIQIEKPSLNPVNQSLTWSTYKDCNTVKILISITPDGHINFKSQAFNGRATDPAIVEQSGYLNNLRPNSHAMVLADRGFKHVEDLVRERNCAFRRPRSVKKSATMTKADVRLSKIISSLRIHVERAIERIRVFTFLEAHSRFHHDFLDLIDSFVTIACSLTNLHRPLIKCS